ncbi:hypothetical protein VDQ74_15095 [Xanthomonas campestris pv. campestris]|nr:hypothetical protein [Xanthomonas campestris pv. campestris]
MAFSKRKGDVSIASKALLHRYWLAKDPSVERCDRELPAIATRRLPESSRLAYVTA